MPMGDDDDEVPSEHEAVDDVSRATPARNLLGRLGRMLLVRAPVPFVATVLGALVLVRALGLEPTRVAIVAVDRLVASPAVYVDRPVRLDGEVLPGTLSSGACSRELVLERNGVKVTVERPKCDPAVGLVDGANVIAEGTLRRDGRFDAYEVVNLDPSPRGR